MLAYYAELFILIAMSFAIGAGVALAIVRLRVRTLAPSAPEASAERGDSK